MREKDSDFKYAPETVREEWLSLVRQLDERADPNALEHFTPDFVRLQGQTPEQIDLIQQAARVRRELYSAEFSGQTEAEVKVKGKLPVTIVHIGDIHWGSIFCNQDLWDSHRKTILETPGVYVMLYHNLVDNAIPGKFPDGTLSNGVPPQEQFTIMQHWIRELESRGKILGAVDGDCHEGWSWSVAGQSPGKLLYGYKGRKFPLLQNGGILTVKFAGDQFRIGMWHKQGPFNSRFNPEHALRQNRRLYHEGGTDLEVGAHYHDATASMSYEGNYGQRRPVGWLRVGTYKGVRGGNLTDKWAVDKFGTSGEDPAPSTILMPEGHIFDTTLDFETGIAKHEAFRTIILIHQMGLADQLRDLLK